jgi:hypothetical protein
MRHLNMLIVMTAMVFVAAGSARGNTSLGPLLLDRAAVPASGLSSLPAMQADKNLSKTVLPTAQEYKIAKLLIAATVGDGKEGDIKNPRSRSTHCPPDKDDRRNFTYRDDDHKGGDNQDRDRDKDRDKDKDKDQHDNCGKGNDSKLP